MKLSTIVKNIDLTVIQGDPGNTEISALVYDSRKAVPGCLFVCIPGFKSDAHSFIPQVIEAGAAALITTHDTDYAIPEDVTVLRVENARLALALASVEWFGRPFEKMTTIGVTGTKGKTTTTYMIRDILLQAGIETGLIGTIETIIKDEHIPSLNTTPESYLLQEYFARMAEQGCRAVVMEVSSQALKLDRVAGVTFDYGIFTNLEEDHIGGDEHPDMADYIYCKSLLFRQCRHGIFNADADHLDEIMKDHTCTVRTYGISGQADVRAEDISGSEVNGTPGVRYTAVRTDGGQRTGIPIDVDMPGDFTVYNSLAAYTVCSMLGIDDEIICSALKGVQVKGRMEILNTPGDYVLMTDYAHNAMALEALLKNLRPHTTGRLICCFGCGGNRSKVRRYEMGEVSSKLADLTVVTSDNPRFEEPLDIIDDILIGVRKGKGEKAL